MELLTTGLSRDFDPSQKYKKTCQQKQAYFQIPMGMLSLEDQKKVEVPQPIWEIWALEDPKLDLMAKKV